MPTCFVTGCKSGYDGKANGRHFFRTSKDKDELTKWAKAIPRKDLQLSDNSRVCDLHFSEELIIKSDSFIVNNDKVEIPRVCWKLKPGAVPHIFPNLPKYLSTPIKSRKRPADRQNVETKRRRKNEEKSKPFRDPVTTKSKGEKNYFLNEPSSSQTDRVDVLKKQNIQLKQQMKNLNRKLSRATNTLSTAKARICLLEKKIKSRPTCQCESNKYLSKKQKMVIDTMIKKCQIKSSHGMRYNNDFILESLLLKIKSPKGYRHCLKRDLLPLPSESHLRNLSKGLKCSYGLNPHALKSILECYKDETDENKRYGILIFDEVKLREELHFNNSTLKLDGFVD